jgi:hypothetical protein
MIGVSAGHKLDFVFHQQLVNSQFDWKKKNIDQPATSYDLRMADFV